MLRVSQLFLLVIVVVGSLTPPEAAARPRGGCSAPPTPSISSSVTNSTIGAFIISWSFAGYNRLERKVNSGAWGLVSTTTGQDDKSYTGQAIGTYQFRVKELSSCGSDSAWSNTATVTVSAPSTPAAPSGPSTTTSDDYSISWSAPSGATSYRVQRKLSTSSSWGSYVTTSSTSRSYNDNPNASYQHRVAACSIVGCSGYSSTKTVTVAQPPAAPGGLNASYTLGNTSVFVSWNAVSHADAYELWEDPPGAGWTKVHDSGQTTDTETLNNGDGTYHYRVRTDENGVLGSYSSVVSINHVTPPGIPGSVNAPTVVDHDTPIALSWGAASGSGTITYNLRYQRNGASPVVLSTPLSGTSTTFTPSQAGTYQFSVQACKGSLCNQTWSGADTTFVRPDVPAAPTVTNADYPVDNIHFTSKPMHRGAIVDLSFPGDPEAGGYIVEWTVNGGSTVYSNPFDGDTTPSIVYTGDGDYAITVRACLTSDQATCSPASTPAPLEWGDLPADPLNSGLYLDETGAEIGFAGLAGAVPYSASVDNSGNARISVPISDPPGIGDLQTALSLEYSSGGARDVIDARLQSGLLGYGWSLRGLSEIRRCRVGVTGDVDMTTADRLCLDGQPLVAVSGSYWAADTFYRTEIDQFVRVKQLGPAATAYFHVQWPNGTTSTYGFDANATVSPRGSSEPYLWSESDRTDAFGNRMDFLYAIDAPFGTNYIKQIAIGPGDASADNTVEFHYEVRDDTLMLDVGADDYVTTGPTNDSNHLATTTLRSEVLSGVSISAGGNLARVYRLTNDAEGGSYVRLTKVEYCAKGEDGAGDLLCAAPLTFGWDTTTSVNDPQGNPIAVPDEYVSNVVTITDSDGGVTTFDYAMVWGAGTPGGDHSYDVSPFGAVVAPDPAKATQNAAFPRCVVKWIDRPSGRLDGGIAETRRTSLAYRGLPHYSLENRGFLGFYEVRRKDEGVPHGASGVFNRVQYVQTRLDFPFIGRVAQAEVYEGEYVTGSDPFGEQEIAWASLSLNAGKSALPYPARVLSLDYEGGTVVGASEATTTLDLNATTQLIDKRTVETRVDQTLTTTSITPTVWGQVPDYALTGDVQTHEREVFLTNVSDATDWLIGFTHQIDERHQRPGQTDTLTRWTMNRLAGTVRPSQRTTTSDPGGSETLSVTEAIAYDAHGNLLSTTADPSDSRSSERGFRFDDTLAGNLVAGRYHTELDELASGSPGGSPGWERSTLGYDQRYGVVDQVTDPNGLVSSSDFDRFGRVTHRTYGDGTEEAITYEDCTAATCGFVTWADAKRRVSVETTNGGVTTAPERRAYMDSRGRVVMREVAAFDAADGFVRTAYKYDAYGRIAEVSLPAFEAVPLTALDFSAVQYDVRGRRTLETRPDGGQISYAYSAASIDADARSVYRQVVATETIKEPGTTPGTFVTVESVQKASRFDALGRLRETVDAHGDTALEVTTHYDYDARGGLAEVKIDDGSSVTTVATIDYDHAGNRRSLTDPNFGTINIEVGDFGEVLASTDAELQRTEFVYDGFGRLTERTEAAGTGDALTSTWTFGTTTDTGRLTARARGGFSEAITYTGDGLVDTVTTTLTGVGLPAGFGTYVVDYDYDATSLQLDSITYPGATTISRTYTAAGYLHQTKLGSTVLDEVTSVDAFGVMTGQALSDGAMTVSRTVQAESGRVESIQSQVHSSNAFITQLESKWRSDGLVYERASLGGTGTADDARETFTYDALKRLGVAQSSLDGVNGRAVTHEYDNFGNITCIDSVGTCLADTHTYSGVTSPHRLTTAVVDGVSTTFGYDANGSITSYDAVTGADTSLSYDALNQVVEIKVQEGSVVEAQDQFEYGPDGARFIKRSEWDDPSGPQESVTVYLAGGVFEEVHPLHDATVDVYQKVQATGAALVRREVAGGSASTVVEYLHRDHLGTVVAVTDDAGNALHELGYDPFGARRLPDWTADLAALDEAVIEAALEKNASRGYTNHEHLERTGFVHMNGRVYDPRLGRFVQTDPLVGRPYESQNYNRYAYTRNSPVSRFDPTGLDDADFVADGPGGVVSISLGDSLISGGASMSASSGEAAHVADIVAADTANEIANAARAADSARPTIIVVPTYSGPVVMTDETATIDARTQAAAEVSTVSAVIGAAVAVALACGPGAPLCEIALWANTGADGPHLGGPTSSSTAGSGVVRVGGRRPINSQYAGGVHPSGVRFTEQGFPDFSPHARAEVVIDGLTGNRRTDNALANRAVGLDETPPGYVWHHVEDGQTMQLVPLELHNAVRHTGGAAIIRNGGIDD